MFIKYEARLQKPWNDTSKVCFPHFVYTIFWEISFSSLQLDIVLNFEIYLIIVNFIHEACYGKASPTIMV